MLKKKTISAKRLKDREMLKKKTRTVAEKVRKARIEKEEIEILNNAGIIPEGKRFARIKLLRPQKAYLAEPDKELVEAYYKTYHLHSKFGKKDRMTIRETGVARKRNYLYFTEIARYCPREVYFRIYMPYRGRDYTTKGLMLFDDGTIHHKEVFNRLESQKMARNPEREIVLPETGAVGYYDWLIPVGDRDGYQIMDLVEFKSKLPMAMDNMSQEDYDQGQLYHYGAQFCPTLKRKRIKIRKIRIFYRDRSLMGSGEPAIAWIVDPDLERRIEIISYAKWLHKTVIEEEYLCPHPYSRDSQKCHWCRFNDWCWTGYPSRPEGELPPPEPEFVTPEKEVLDSLGTRFLEILKKIKKLDKEKDEISSVFLNYFAETKILSYPVSEDKALAPIIPQGKKFDKKFLIGALGFRLYSLISNPNAKFIDKEIKAGRIDPEIIEKAISYAVRKAYISVVNRKEGEGER